MGRALGLSAVSWLVGLQATGLVSLVMSDYVRIFSIDVVGGDVGGGGAVLERNLSMRNVRMVLDLRLGWDYRHGRYQTHV